ncbi:hypothetical protein ABPG75_005360 [Micractinium tetrahymenae]
MPLSTRPTLNQIPPALPRRPPRPLQFVRQWGTAGKHDSQFTKVGGSAVSPNDKVLYVMDRWNYRCQAFNTSDGAFLFAWGDMGVGPSEFMSAGSVATCPDGTVVIADSYNGRIQHFRADGAYISEMQSVGQFDVLHAVGCNKEGKILALDDQDVHWFDPQSGAMISKWKYQDATPVRPGGLAVNPVNGEVYVLVLKADAAVRRFSPAGKLLSTFGTLSAAGDTLQFATFNIAADAKGGVFVADSAQLTTRRRLAAAGTFLRISHYHAASGQLMSQFGADGSSAHQIAAPSGIAAIRSSRELFVSDELNERVTKWVPTMGAGGWGDPHFQGFDGVRFTQHAPVGSWVNLLVAPVEDFKVSALLGAGVMPGTTWMVEVKARLGGLDFSCKLVKDGASWRMQASVDGASLAEGTTVVKGNKLVFSRGSPGKHGRLQVDVQGKARVVVSQMWRPDQKQLADYLNAGIQVVGKLRAPVTGVLADSYWKALLARTSATSAVSGASAAASVPVLSASV